MFNCGIVMDGLIESAHDEVSKIGSKEIFVLTYNNQDNLYYHTNDYGTYIFSGKNYLKHSNGRVKEQSQFKKGKKHGNWFWYNEQGRKLKKEVWDVGNLISEKKY